MAMATKLGRVVSYDEGNSTIMSDDPLVTWSHDVMWQIENLISPLPQGVWLSNVADWWLMVRVNHLCGHMILWKRGDVSSRDKLKAQQILFGEAYGNETWEVGDLW